jgi:hypothetical protein
MNFPPSKLNYILNDEVKENVMSMACSTHGGKTNAYRVLMGMPEERKPLGRPRRMWEDKIKMDVREIGWGGMD